MLLPDCPDLCRIMSRFIARLVIDECIDANYVCSMALLNSESEIGIKIINDSFALLIDDCSKEHGMVIWNKEIDLNEAKTFFNEIIDKFFETGNIEEIVNELKKSKWAFFNHEFVRLLCISTFDRITEVLFSEI